MLAADVLSTRARNCLANAGVPWFEQTKRRIKPLLPRLRQGARDDNGHPLAIRNLGRKTLAEIEAWVKS